jgi:hypothetical protein
MEWGYMGVSIFSKKTQEMMGETARKVNLHQGKEFW